MCFKNILNHIKYANKRVLEGTIFEISDWSVYDFKKSIIFDGKFCSRSPCSDQLKYFLPQKGGRISITQTLPYCPLRIIKNITILVA